MDDDQSGLADNAEAPELDRPTRFNMVDAAVALARIETLVEAAKLPISPQ